MQDKVTSFTEVALKSPTIREAIKQLFNEGWEYMGLNRQGDAFRFARAWVNK